MRIFFSKNVVNIIHVVFVTQVHTPFSKEQAVYARDAFAKGLYERMFSWLVKEINISLVAGTDGGRKCVLGILDIYGFEIFDVNSFEQFCINYCNEKLQQLFITLTLKSEQEEYLNEGIKVSSIHEGIISSMQTTTHIESMTVVPLDTVIESVK